MKSDSEIIVRLWRQGEDLTPVKQFWYDIYVTEMGRHRDTADHTRRQLNDERAEVGQVIVALKDGNVIGTLICTPSWTGALGEYEALYNMKGLGSMHPHSTAIITKLMVAKEYRHTMLSIRISCELYRQAVPLGVHCPIIDCNDHLVPLFTRIGFTRWGPNVTHPVYGPVNVMKLDCLDLQHLSAIKSPLLPVAQEIVPHVNQKIKFTSTKEPLYERV